MSLFLRWKSTNVHGRSLIAAVLDAKAKAQAPVAEEVAPEVVEAPTVEGRILLKGFKIAFHQILPPVVPPAIPSEMHTI